MPYPLGHGATCFFRVSQLHWCPKVVDPGWGGVGASQVEVLVVFRDAMRKRVTALGFEDV